ncbi:MAG: hypothetical protein JJT88_08075 [Gammaproteobacteria bacterium]|nr:hypothetical protein [Gammaproteobacteria bacterium]
MTRIDASGAGSRNASVCLLTAFDAPEPSENAALVAPALAERGMQVHSAAIDSLSLRNGGIEARSREGTIDLATCSWIWTLGFGRRKSFLDKMQLLALLPAAVRQVTRPEALLLWHGKYGLAAQAELPHPMTWASSKADELIAIATREGGRFVLKPPGGSFGQGLVVADAASPRLAWAARALTRQGAYCLLQRYLPDVADGEYRVLVAGGRVIAGYRRCGSGPAGNLARGGRAEVAALEPHTLALAERAARWLQEKQIGYAGLDIAGGSLLEVNIVNPGGLSTLRDIGAGDFAAAVVSAILDAAVSRL